MATEDQNKQQADHNQSFLNCIDRGKYPDWVATVAFYKAVHLVQMLFMKRGHDTGSHQKRNGILKRQYPELWKAYRPLFAFSRLTRYRCYRTTAAEVEYLLRHLGRTDTIITKSMQS